MAQNFWERLSPLAKGFSLVAMLLLVTLIAIASWQAH
jgi:hypothetical protein